MDKEKSSIHSVQGKRKGILLCLLLLQRKWAKVSQTEWKRQGYTEVPSENVHSDTILKAPPVTNPWNKQDLDSLNCVFVCVCASWTWPWSGRKRVGQTFTHSTHLLDVLQTEVAPTNKWICVLLILLFPLSDEDKKGSTIFHNFLTT